MPVIRILLIVLCLGLAGSGCARKNTAGPAGPGQAVRLSTEVAPVRYDITITPNVAAMTFRASARIAVDVQGETARVVLNAADLTVDRAVLEDGSTARVSYDARRQTMTLAFPKTLGPGRHTLLMDYRGKINTGASGLFASDYQTDDGAHRRLLLTQFESADFRRFAPSWDEPARKAVFQLTLIAPADQSAVSNMPAASVQAAPGGTKKIVFQPTPKMSTYLVFLAVGDLERVSRNVDGTEIGVVARKGVSGQTTVALDAAEEQLRYYNRYFGMKYPLPKLDLIAAPGSGSFGAMENWGAILFFEPYLLADPKTSSESDRQRIHVYLAHEIAHQWFGNLVTMAWWDDLWLNESFASWMENKAIGDLHPGWGYDLVALDARETAMRLDATAATHPIVQPAETLEQVNGAGDAITYEKGASVIRMLEAYVGPDAFRNGVQAYLRANAYGNATREDLWRAVEAAANKPLLRIAKDFTEQAGVPLVRVDPVSADNGAEVVLRQGRF
ncbi:MAG: M1 family metallopeptidase, partial [Caulobacteraceae bacterium]